MNADSALLAKSGIYLDVGLFSFLLRNGEGWGLRPWFLHQFNYKQIPLHQVKFVSGSAIDKKDI